METLQLSREIDNLPIELRQEVIDFVDFLKFKHLKNKSLKQREYGFGKGKIKINDDFDTPLEEFKDYI